MQNVYAYPYDAAAGTVGTRTTVINGMNNGGLHLTRTLLIPKAAPNLLLVQRGSDGNIDATTTQQSSGRSQTRIFDLTTIGSGGVAYTSGQVLGWGLRNSVGLGEDISTGGIWSVENSVDDMRKGGQDVHNDNPGEELNYHGVITNTSAIERGANYGYPDCFAAWKMNNIPVGTQFAIDSPSGGSTDATCASTKMAPKLTFPSHTAPLDVKFRADGTAAFISFHGSW